jgi:voltage-gated potassium channel Kch
MHQTSDTAAAWWISIGIGITVVLCVIVLLSLVTAFVNDIDFHVDVVVEEVNHVSNNTVTSPDLHEAARLIGALGVELETHVERLENGTGYL